MSTLLRALRPAALALVAAAALAPESGLAAAVAPGPAGAPEDTLKRIVQLPAIEVSTARAGERTPVTRSVLGRAEIERANWGQDTPMALATVPGTYAYSDAGNGIGYSYLSIRGFPQRRISVLINGVPLNDPESHEVYWIDHPDLLASTSEVQVQRGVGSALYGGASLGGSVNLETSPFGESRRLSSSFAYGSFETQRLMLEYDSGRLEGDWNLYGRYSRIRTSGYRDNSWSRLWSYYLSARKLTGSHSVRVNLYGGPEETHLAYYGVPREYLRNDRDRRINPIGFANERDHFFEPHYEMIHSWSPAANIAFTQTLFYNDGRGYYDERRMGDTLATYRLAPWQTADPNLYPPEYYSRDKDGNLIQDPSGLYTIVCFDLVRRRDVANRHLGWVPRVRVEHARGAITLGGEIRHHDGHHWGEVLSGNGLPPSTVPHHTYYDYHPRTLSAGLFAREEFRLSEPLLVTADLAWRHQSYFMQGDRFDGIRFDQPYDFAVPRLGLTYAPNDRWIAFASWAYASREPAFRDLYDAERAGSVPLYRRLDVPLGVYEDPLIKPERASDFEVGGTWRGRAASASVHGFRMDFRDELVSSGQYNLDMGYAILGNAARSVHQGIELAAHLERSLAPGFGLSLNLSGTLSDNHLKRYREFITVPGPTGTDSLVQLNYDGKRLGLFPSAIGNLSARLSWRRVTLGADVQSVGRIYLDHSEDRLASIDPRTVLDMQGTVRLPWRRPSAMELSVRVRNVTNVLYETSGYTYFYEGVKYAEFFPAATRSVLAEVRMDF